MPKSIYTGIDATWLRLQYAKTGTTHRDFIVWCKKMGANVEQGLIRGHIGGVGGDRKPIGVGTGYAIAYKAFFQYAAHIFSKNGHDN